MSAEKSAIMNIALVGGGQLCKEIIEKTTYVFRQEGIEAPIVAVADPNPEAPGIIIAEDLDLKTIADHHELYDPEYGIQLIIILSPEQALLNDILLSKPPHIRVMSYHVFDIFWKAIGLEERKLRERTEEMETILNGIQNLISVISPDMKLMEVNEMFLKQMNSPRDEVIGRYCYEIFQGRSKPCDEAVMPCPLMDVIRNKRQVRQIMTRGHSRKDLRYFEVTIYPIWENDGRISKFIEISRDITEHKREEEEITRRLEQMVEERTRELKETHDKLLHQDKMASLGKLSASVVHEINNPIAGILTMTMLMKRIMGEESLTTSEQDRFSNYLTIMEAETRRISKIVSNLLAFSRQSRLEMKQLHLNRLVEKTLFLNANLLKISGVNVARRLDPNLPYMVGSEDQLQQVFMNIISNAAEVMEGNDGGILTVETKHSLREGAIIVKFRDTGSGISSQNLTKIFEPFFTTKKKGKGVGLGLSLAYGIIQEHNGSIDVKSKKGEGAAFTIRFPLKQH